MNLGQQQRKQLNSKYYSFVMLPFALNCFAFVDFFSVILHAYFYFFFSLAHCNLCPYWLYLCINQSPLCHLSYTEGVPLTRYIIRSLFSVNKTGFIFGLNYESFYKRKTRENVQLLQ